MKAHVPAWVGAHWRLSWGLALYGQLPTLALLGL